MNQTVIKVNGVNLHVTTDGPEDGEPVILLHGFPEFWYGWRHQIPALVEAGFRVIIPDQRGYNLSDKPPKVEDYKLDTLAADIAALIEHFGYTQVNLIGHDWGAIVAWWIAIIYPEKIKRLGILNVPHPVVFMNTVRSNPLQMLKSWYVGFFQIPALPEAFLAGNNAEAMARAMKASARPDTFSDEDLAMYREAWTRPDALKSMINWYRAIVRHRPDVTGSARVRIPTLMIWGEKDIALDVSMAESSIKMCDRGHLVKIREATHWVQHDARSQVSGLLVDFLTDQMTELTG